MEVETPNVKLYSDPVLVSKSGRVTGGGVESRLRRVKDSRTL